MLDTDYRPRCYGSRLPGATEAADGEVENESGDGIFSAWRRLRPSRFGGPDRRTHPRTGRLRAGPGQCRHNDVAMSRLLWVESARLPERDPRRARNISTPDFLVAGQRHLSRDARRCELIPDSIRTLPSTCWSGQRPGPSHQNSYISQEFLQKTGTPSSTFSFAAQATFRSVSFE